MIFTLDVRPARKGDCLLMHFGKPEARGLAVIDGGPSHVYQPQLKPRLAAINSACGGTDHNTLPVDLLMVSHIDDDHIAGVLELTGELVEAQRARRPPSVRLRRLWHNTFDDIIGNDPADLIAAVTAHFGPASLTGEADTAGLSPDVAMVLASVGQGRQLRDDARALNLDVNPEFKGGLVRAVKRSKAVDLGKGLRLTVVGPMKAELAALQQEHDAYLKSRSGHPSAAALAGFTDGSAPNLSSIVVLAEVSRKRMLLTGDARGDRILAGLELTGLLKPHQSMHVDVLKMPHHGSDRNMDRAFLERVTADHYVFSGNGQHGNPERATLEMLLAARGPTTRYVIHLTYPVEAIDEARKADWEKEQRKEKVRKRYSSGTAVREDWSARRHALGALFDDYPQFGSKVTTVSNGQPHLIELLDPVGL
jgi:hypothetical protein